jgi:hypothetical protein
LSSALKNPAELFGRLGVSESETLLLVDAPPELERLLTEGRPGAEPPVPVASDRLRSVKSVFDVALIWRENRVGSQALLAAAVRRVAEGGSLWVVTAMRKVQGPATPAAHRLDRGDLEKALGPEGFAADREARFTAWHVGYRFRRRPPGAAAPYST